MSNPIGWCDRTWNPVTGCTKVSQGCKNCYAERMARRLQAMGQPRYANGFKVTLHEDALDAPLRRRKPQRIFVCSMSDLFHDDIPFEFIDKVFATMMLSPQHTFMVLTKRAERMAQYLTAEDRMVFWHDGGIAPRPANTPTKVLWRAQRLCETLNLLGEYPWGDEMDWPLPNVWAGVSVESQDYAWRLDHLAKVPAAVRFVSAEPLLGPLDLRKWLHPQGNDARQSLSEYDAPETPPALDWVIAGCESGPKRRHAEVDWFRSLRDQCRAAGVSFWLKQMEIDGKVVHSPLLDGVAHQEVPR